MAERRGRERFACEQPPYSLLVRGIEAEVLPACERYGMGVITWSPLGGGWLSGRYREGAELPTSGRAARLPQRFDMTLPGNQAKLAATELLAKLAEELGISLVHLALAFVLEHPTVTSAIIGPAHDGAARVAARRRRAPARCGDARPDRRDRAAGRHPQPGRRRLGATALADPANRRR